MDLSIVIVNYNVRYFLEQCLHSVQRAQTTLKENGLSSETWVVDNDSADGSVAYIKDKFQNIKLIANKENVGFSRANNQAMREAKGRYILLLNPDTVVEETTFLECIRFMDEHPDAGALGVKMIDGKGVFLPESKRSLPTPEVSFYKMFGLAGLFPRSRRFGKYHLGYLDKEETHEVDVLAGAFMFMRKETLDKTGLLDETFFMYGEDIDLSYRITQAGYKNYYFPGSTIIHYKGESTKKGSLNYVRIFYQAMIIFAGKHFSSRKARTFRILINLAIYFRAALSLVKRFVQRIYRPLLDGLLIFLGYFLALPFWEQVRFNAAGYYPSEFLHYVVPAYILVWLTALYYSGAYDKPMKLWHFFRGHLAGLLIILVIYALLPAEWRFSRALIFMGSLWGLVSTLLVRVVFHMLGFADYQIDLNRQKRMVIVGRLQEAERVKSLLMETQAKPEILGYVYPSEKQAEHPDYIGRIDQVEEIASVNKVDEIVFCLRDLESKTIMQIMSRLIGSSMDFKIAPPESLSVIGSNSINTAGDLYTIEFNSIGKASNRRNKRLLDLVTSLLLFVTFPLWIFFVKGNFKALGHCLMVLSGSRTWVSYMPGHSGDPLPDLKKGYLHPGMHLAGEQPENEKIRAINVQYSKNYKVSNDLLIIAKNFRSI